MKRFVFRLQRVLELRAEAERACAGALAQALAAETERRRVLATTSEHQAHVDATRTPAPGQILHAGTLHHLHLTAEAAASHVDAASASLDRAREDVDQERERYQDAAVERKALERLRERRHDTWKGEVARTERHVLDEVALRTHRNRDETKERDAS